VISLFKRVYGTSPLHLLGQLVAFAIAAYAFTQVTKVGSTDTKSLLIWFIGGALLHDLVFLPIYVVLDFIARHGIRDHHPQRRVRAINYIRFPVAISGLLLVTAFPLIIGRSESNYVRLTGEQPPDWFAHWLLATAVVFGVSALAYAVRLRRSDPSAAPAAARADV